MGANYCWSKLRITLFSNRPFRMFQHLGHFSVTAGNWWWWYNLPDWSGNLLSLGGSFLSKIGRKYFKFPCPNITCQVSKLYPWNMQYWKFSNCKNFNFGRKKFDNSTSIRQIHQIFPPPKFCTIWYTLIDFVS